MKKLCYEKKVADYYVKFRDFKVRSINDMVNLGVTLYVPKGKIKGILQISHGMMEHRKRYIEFMNYMGENGYICVVHDHIGHGESVKSKEDYGYFYNNGALNLVEDLHQITLYMKRRYKNYPYYLFGFSMGALIARAYIKKYDYELNGLILCGSPVKNNFIPCIKKLCEIIKKIKGDHYRSMFVHRIIRGIGDNVLTHAKDEKKEVIEDESCGFIFTINGFHTLCNLILNDYSKRNWIRKNLDMPILSIAGEEDMVIISIRKFNQLTNFIRKIGYTNVYHKIYAKKYHDLLHEDNKSEIYRDILVWINKFNTV